MGRIVVSEFVTVDGVMEAPGFEEHRSGRNAWALRLSDDEMQRFKRDELYEAAAVLLGRTTYEIWAAFWPSLADEDMFGRRVNAMPKYVVSRSLTRAHWNNTTVLSGEVGAEVAHLRQEVDGDILVVGSADLVAELSNLGLVDEYRLMQFPVILGSGKRLFRDEADTNHLRLVDARTFASGIVLLTYEPVAEAPAGKFTEAYSWTREQVESLHAARDTDRVLATVEYENGALASFYHAFDKPSRLEQTTARLAFDRGYVEVDGWLERADPEAVQAFLTHLLRRPKVKDLLGHPEVKTLIQKLLRQG